MLNTMLDSLKNILKRCVIEQALLITVISSGSGISSIVVAVVYCFFCFFFIKILLLCVFVQQRNRARGAVKPWLACDSKLQYTLRALSNKQQQQQPKPKLSTVIGNAKCKANILSLSQPRNTVSKSRRRRRWWRQTVQRF